MCFAKIYVKVKLMIIAIRLSGINMIAMSADRLLKQPSLSQIWNTTPTPSTRRRLLILLNGCKIWTDVLKADCRRKILFSIHRTPSLKVASLCGKLSKPAAVLITSGVVPARFTDKATKETLGKASRVNGQRIRTNEERRRTLQRWNVGTKRKVDSETYPRYRTMSRMECTGLTIIEHS